LKPFAPTLRLVLIAHLHALHVVASLLDTDCQVAGGPLDCKLHNVLHILTVLAAVFGVVLLIVGLGAWIYYRRSRTRRFEGEGRR
jgi:hypothetical protein